MMFLGVGFPNSVSIVMADVPEVIRFYGYEAQGFVVLTWFFESNVDRLQLRIPSGWRSVDNK